jgi:hypothetical protein
VKHNIPEEGRNWEGRSFYNELQNTVNKKWNDYIINGGDCSEQIGIKPTGDII